MRKMLVARRPPHVAAGGERPVPPLNDARCAVAIKGGARAPAGQPQ
jgi:hypothetical protein